MQSFNEWTDKKIKDDNLYFFKYNKFTNVEIVEKGTFATISKADWKNGISVALKILGNNPSINENDMNKFIKEFKNLRRASFHSNINRLYGITKEPSTNTYMMKFACKKHTSPQEQPITDTPSAYVELYEKCWDDNPSLRPTIEEVFDTLQKISQQINANNENGSKITEDLDKLDINNETNSDSINQNDSKLQISKTKNDNIDKNKNELSNILSEIIQAYLERNKIGKTKSFNFDTILEKYKSKSREIFKYLIKNTSTKHYEVMVGKFHKEGFGTIKNEGVAFKWFMKASKNDDINGHYEVGYCYFYACGTEDNDEKATDEVVVRHYEITVPHYTCHKM
ncbi:unnamed protein product [Rhizophagus irregularis]|nr:unnamed protein product [Rhizophagus irregularis]